MTARLLLNRIAKVGCPMRALRRSIAAHFDLARNPEANVVPMKQLKVATTRLEQRRLGLIEPNDALLRAILPTASEGYTIPVRLHANEVAPALSGGRAVPLAANECHVRSWLAEGYHTRSAVRRSAA